MKSREVEKVAVLSVSLMRFSGEILSTVLANIALEYNNIPAMWIQLLLTISTISLIPALFLAAPLVKATSLKKATLIALVITICGGLIPFFVTSFSLMVISRVILGLGVGLLNPISAALITERYEGNEKKFLIGCRTAVASLGVVALSLIGGALTKFGWRYLVLSYLMGIPVIIFLLFFVPNFNTDNKHANSFVEQPTKKSFHLTQINASLLYATVLIFFYTLVINVYSTNISMLVLGEGLGDASNVSILIALNKASTFLSGLLFAKVSNMLKRWTMPIYLCLSCTAMLLIWMGHSLVMFSCASVLAGFAMGIILALGIFWASESLPAGNDTAAISFLTAGMNFGQFFSPVVMTPLFTALLGMQVRGAFAIASIGMAALTLATVFKEIFRGECTVVKQ
jgi:MFS family permease